MSLNMTHLIRVHFVLLSSMTIHQCRQGRKKFFFSSSSLVFFCLLTRKKNNHSFQRIRYLHT